MVTATDYYTTAPRRAWSSTPVHIYQVLLHITPLAFLSRGTGISQHVASSNTTRHTPTHNSIHERYLYQVPDTQQVGYPFLWTWAALVPATLVVGTMSMHCDYSTHLRYSFHAVPVSVDTSGPLPVHIPKPIVL